MSDIHFGAEDPGLVEALAVRLDEVRPDVVVASGDFTMAGRRREFQRAAAFVESLGVPVVATPGNHDIPVQNLAERFARPFARYHRWMGPVTVGQYVDARCALLALNSARAWDLSFNWSHGRLSDGQVAEADRFFARAPGSRFRALVVHHPFYVPEELPGFRLIGNGEAMLEVLARRGVHAVLSGHLHQRHMATREIAIEGERRRVVVLQVASPTTTRRRDQPNAFHVLEVGAAGVVMTEQVAVDGVFAEGERNEVVRFGGAQETGPCETALGRAGGA